MVLANTLVSIDTYVQWLRLSASGKVKGVYAGLIQIRVNQQIDIHRDLQLYIGKRFPDFANAELVGRG
jgi:hypothetical protein